MKKILTRLYGGHRNQVFKTDGVVEVVWKDGFERKEQIRDGVLLENFVAVHTDITARALVDKSKPVQEEEGKLVTYFHYCEGEIRYPWNLAEIASAAKLLGKLHPKMNPLVSKKDSPWRTPRRVLKRFNKLQLHLDFARGNILFQPGTLDAVAVIDFETTAIGPIEQELGRTLSFLLVDTPLVFKDSPPGRVLEGESFLERWNAFLTNYTLPFRKDKVINWTLRYLTDEDYGSLNNVRDKALSFLSSSRAKERTLSPQAKCYVLKSRDLASAI